MFFQTSSRLLLVLGIILCLYSAESSAETVCHRWWKTLPPGSRNMTVRLTKRDNSNSVGRINSRDSAKLLPPAPQGGACPQTYPQGTKGVCLWAGLNSVDEVPSGLQSGWVTGSNTKNCGAAIFANRGDRHVEGTVVDVCLFNEGGRKLTVAEGCSTMYVTDGMFAALGGKQGDNKITIDNWDFAGSPY